MIALRIDDGALFNPADFVLIRLYPQKAASVLQHFELLSVDDLADAIGNGGHAIMQVHLPGGNIDGLMLLAAQPVATCIEEKNAGQKQSGITGHCMPDR
jgi:hypothetical protein